jgi:uncharacterized membrane protein YfcA
VSALEVVAVVLAGMAAGTINTVVGSGTLITFPVLLAVGFSPLVANVSNTIGLVPGSVSGAIGYRRELAGQRTRVFRLGTAAALGGTTGGVLLLVLPESAFKAIVPLFIAAALVLIVLQPRLSAWVAKRRGEVHEHRTAAAAATYATGIYGGYFGAAQGILLMAFLGILLDEHMQRLNAVKNVLAGLVNAVAAVVFVLASEVAWDAVAVIAIGSTVGGQLGGMYGRRLPPNVLRGIIVVVGTTAAVRLLVT